MTSENFNSQAFAQETSVALIDLLTLSVEGESEPVLICDVPHQKFPDLGEEVYGVESNGKRFIYLPFNVTLPRDDKTGSVTAKLTIENVDRNIIRYARGYLKPIDVKIQVVLSSDTNYVEIEFSDFKLTNINYDGFQIEGDLSIEYLGLEPFPSGRFTPSGFPGLF